MEECEVEFSRIKRMWRTGHVRNGHGKRISSGLVRGLPACSLSERIATEPWTSAVLANDASCVVKMARHVLLPFWSYSACLYLSQLQYEQTLQ